MNNNSNKYLNEIKNIVEKEIEKTSLLRELSLLLKVDPINYMTKNNSTFSFGEYKDNNIIIQDINDVQKLDETSNNTIKNSIQVRLEKLNEYGINFPNLMPSISNTTTGGRKKRVPKKRITKK